jgi:iron complex outermembrane receptor protein
MVMTYASYARGYKGPALASTPAVAFPVIRPEIPTAWEIGIKSSFLDRKVVFNVSAWYEKFRNFQAQATDIVTNFSGLLNAGSLISKGAEASLVVNPIRGLTLSGDVVYTDAYYGSFQGLPCYGGQPTGTSGVNVCLPNRTTDATGNRLANSSKWTYTLGADYSFEVAEDRTVKVGANWNYRSTTNFLAAGNPRTRQNGYGLLGGDIALSSKLNGWTLAVFGRNILNKHFYSFITQSPVDGFLGDSARGGNYAAFFSPDGIRTIGVSLRKSF